VAVFTGILIASTGGPDIPMTSTGGLPLWQGVVSRVRRWFVEQHQRRMSIDQLQVMNDGELRDIGLIREDLPGDADRRLWEPRLGMTGQARNIRPGIEEDWRTR
ncbi:DUF1127 domain-containing protein, partial [Hypericibacter sp.]|uniref:DUF1127 domain-containing protein n=1 Tax=Hypericibacter sp. TaxID=2705401 RepID=UPI003D6CE893